MLKYNTEYSGLQFNEIHKDKKFYKFLKNDLVHYGFRLRLGLNIDIVTLNTHSSYEPNPNIEYTRGGFCFCEESTCYLYWDTYGTKVAKIEIPDDARVYVDKNKFRSNKIILKEIIDFNEANNDFWFAILHKNFTVLKYIKEPIESGKDFYDMIIQKNGLALKYVIDNYVTVELCRSAVNQNGLALQYVKEQFMTDDILRSAIIQNSFALQYVKKVYPSCSQSRSLLEELCTIAVKKNGITLQFVNMISLQTEELCISAVQQNGHALEYVNEQTGEICANAVKQNGYALKFVIDQTDEICRLAVKQAGNALQYVKDQTEEICILALRQNKCSYAYIKEQFKTENLYKLSNQKYY